MPTSAYRDTNPGHDGGRGRPELPRGLRDVAPLRRPYPTATTVTRLSPARAGTDPIQRTSPRAPSAVPATVWTFGTGNPGALSPRTDRLGRTLERIVASFAPPGGTVAFLPWPTPSDGTDTADELVLTTSAGASAVATARAAGFAARMIDSRGAATPTGVHTDAAAGGQGEQALGHLAGRVRPSSLDLIVTSTGPDGIDEPSADHVTLLAARALRAGGILGVLTQSHHRGPALQDRTGTVVTAAQNADLLYLQHVVAVHGPVHHLDTDPTAADGEGRHRLVHDDLLVLVQPRDHALDLANEAAA